MHRADAPGGRARIFVVDDDAGMRTLFGRVMTLEGHEPVLFNEPMPALNAIQAGMQVDLMLTDMNLGGNMTGLDLAREARRVRPDLPVVMVTGVYDTPASPDVAAMLFKPFRVHELVSTVAHCLAGP